MENSVLPYELSNKSSNTSSESSSDSDSDSSENSYSDNLMLLSSNIGILNKPNEINNDNKFLNFEKQKEYQITRNKLFSPEIRKHRIVVESKSLEHTNSHSTSNYVVYFDSDTSSVHNGYYTYDNVIGFKFIKSIIPNSIYQVNENNNVIQIQIQGQNTVSVTLNIGPYNFIDLGNHLNDKLQEIDPNFSVISDQLYYTYKIMFSSDFRILWENDSSSSWRLFGFLNINTDYKSSHVSNSIIQHNSHFVDLVIPEIPYIACKHNNTGKSLIERIPLGLPGEIKEYVNDYNLDNYFYPIKLSKITIQLYEDSTDMFYQAQNADNSFEFEITILNK